MLSSGGFGKVYKAFDRVNKREVVVKVNAESEMNETLGDNSESDDDNEKEEVKSRRISPGHKSKHQRKAGLLQYHHLKMNQVPKI